VLECVRGRARYSAVRYGLPAGGEALQRTTRRKQGRGARGSTSAAKGGAPGAPAPGAKAPEAKALSAGAPAFSAGAPALSVRTMYGLRVADGSGGAADGAGAADGGAGAIGSSGAGRSTLYALSVRAKDTL